MQIARSSTDTQKGPAGRLTGDVSVDAIADAQHGASPGQA
jgi:hypothetical protein